MAGMRIPGSSSSQVYDDELIRHIADDDPDFVDKILGHTGATSSGKKAALDHLRQIAFRPGPKPVTEEEKRRAKEDMQRERANFYQKTDTGIF